MPGCPVNMKGVYEICGKFIFVRLSLTRNLEIARLKLNSVRVVVSIVKSTSLNTPGLILVGIVFKSPSTGTLNRGNRNPPVYFIERVLYGSIIT